MGQVGACVANSGWTVAGGFLGAVVYGLLQPLIPVDGHSKFVRGDKPSIETCAS